jgi:TM2 domain-containing membrane protein YozV
MKKDKTVALLLCLFLGGIGIHRYYMDRIMTGTIMFGIFLIGMLAHIYSKEYPHSILLYVWGIN